MTRDRDPDRRRPAPTHAGFDHREIDVDMDICRWCGALVPADEKHRIRHEDWDQRIANRFIQLLERVALLEASDPGLTPSGSTGATAELSPGSDPTSGAGERGEEPAATAATQRHDPAPDPTVPTPPQEDNGSRGGVEDANDSLDAGLPPGVAQAPDAPTSPGGSSGAAKRAGRGSGGSGEDHGSAPAGTTARLHLVDTEPPDYWGRFGR